MYEAPVNLEHDRLLGRDSPRVPCLDNRPTYAPEREASMGTRETRPRELVLAKAVSPGREPRSPAARASWPSTRAHPP